jgi:hypothetical protein
MKKIITIIFLIALLAIPAHAGQLYQWIDENGAVHMTDYPPPPGMTVISARNAEPASPREIADAERQRKYDAEMNELLRQQFEARIDYNRHSRREVERIKENLPIMKEDRERLWQQYIHAGDVHQRASYKSMLDRQDRRIEQMESFVQGR